MGVRRNLHTEEAILEEVPDPAMSTVHYPGVTAEQSLHSCGDEPLRATQDSVKVGRHQTPCKSFPAVRRRDPVERQPELASVDRVPDDPPTVVSSRNDVIDRTGIEVA